MTVNAGSIKYTVEAETGELLTAEKVVDKSTDSMAKDFNKVDVAVKKTGLEVKKTAKAVDEALKSEAKSAERAARTIEREAERKAKSTERAAERSKVAAEKAANTEIAAAKRAAAATAAEAKKAAAAKIAAANKAAAATAAANKRSTIAEQKRISGVGRASGQAGIQVQQFIGQIQGGQNAMLALSAQSADLGFVLGAPLLGAVVGISASLLGMMLPALFKSSEATKDFKFNVVDAAKELENLNDLSKAQVSVAMRETGKSMDELSKAAGKSGEAIASINSSLDKGTKEQVTYTRSGTAIIEVVKLTEKETKKLNASLENEMANLDKINQEYKLESDLLVQLSKNKDGFSKKTEDQNEKVTSLTTSLEGQIVALREGEEAAFRWSTAQGLGMKAGEKFTDEVDGQIKEIFRLRQAKEDDAKKDSETKKGVALSESVIKKGLSPEEIMKAEMSVLANLRDTDLENKKLHEEAITSLELQHSEKRKQISEKTKEEQLVNWKSIENQAVGSLAAIATGAMTGKEAMRSLAQSILTQMVGALIKMGIQAVIGQTTVATATSASMVAIAAAAAPAAALVSLATSGANAPLATAGMTAAATAATAIAMPGRQFGGGVSGGNSYRVGEAGPEILQQGGKNYMIPGQSGNVISNNDLGGGGTTININNMANGVEVQARPSPDGKIIEISVRQAVAEMTNQVTSGNGKFMNALKSNTNMTSKASR